MSEQHISKAAERDPFAVEAQPAAESPFAEPTNRERELALETWGAFDEETGFDETDVKGASNLALEVLVTWGNSVLHVAHLSPPRSFVLGTAGGDEAKADFFLPESVLGRQRLPVVLVEDGIVRVVVPDVAQGVVKQGSSSGSLQDVMEGAEICETVTRARQQRLGAGMHVAMTLPGVNVRVGLVQKGRPVPKGVLANWDWSVPSYFGMTLGAAGALMGAMAYFVPPMGLEDEGALSQDRLLLISQLLDASSERDQKREEAVAQPESGDDEGRSGERAQGAEGEAGKENEERTGKRVAIKGPRDTQTATVSRLEAITLAREFGMVGLLAGANQNDAPMSAFARDIALGPDEQSFDGAMFGDTIGESGGMGGLGLSGPGSGGGDLFGDGSSIGVNKWGSLGGGLRLKGGGPGRIGNSLGRTGPGHPPKVPRIRPSKTSVNGHIPPQVIQRIVRQNFGRFRMCYEQGLARNPSLEGRIPVRFIVGSDGAVSNASASGGFPDAAVKSCVVSAFYGLSFPAPDHGIVTVTYPLMFSPG